MNSERKIQIKNFNFLEEEVDKTVILRRVNEDPFVLESLNEYFRSDREIIFECLKKDGFLLKFASINIKNDREFIMGVLNEYLGQIHKLLIEFDEDYEKECEYYFTYDGTKVYLGIESFYRKYCGDIEGSKFIKNEELIEKILPQCRRFLKFSQITELERVRKNYGLILKFCSKNLQDDYDLVLKCVKKYGLSIKFSSRDLQENDVIVNYAIRNDKRVINLLRKRNF